MSLCGGPPPSVLRERHWPTVPTRSTTRARPADVRPVSRRILAMTAGPSRRCDRQSALVLRCSRVAPTDALRKRSTWSLNRYDATIDPSICESLPFRQGCSWTSTDVHRRSPTYGKRSGSERRQRAGARQGIERRGIGSPRRRRFMAGDLRCSRQRPAEARSPPTRSIAWPHRRWSAGLDALSCPTMIATWSGRRRERSTRRSRDAALLQGWRVSEALGFGWEDLDLDAGIAVVRRTVTLEDECCVRLSAVDE